MANASISKAWDETRAIALRDSRLFVAIGLALFVLPGTIAAVVDPSMLQGVAPSETGNAVLWIAVMVVGLVGRLALVRLALGGHSVGDAIREGAARTPSVIGAILVFMTPVMLLMMPVVPRLLATPDSPDPNAALALFVILITALVLGVRLILLIPAIAIAERGNPFRLLKRNWQLSGGNWWRLIGFALLYFLASAIVIQVVQMIVGTIIRLLGWTTDPLSFGALALGLATSGIGAVFTVLFAIMVARVYAQLAGAGASEVSVPSSRD